MRAVVNKYKENCAKVLLSNKACILEMHMTRPNYDSELLFHIDAYVNAIYLYHNYFIIGYLHNKNVLVCKHSEMGTTVRWSPFLTSEVLLCILVLGHRTVKNGE